MENNKDKELKMKYLKKKKECEQLRKMLMQCMKNIISSNNNKQKTCHESSYNLKRNKTNINTNTDIDNDSDSDSDSDSESDSNGNDKNTKYNPINPFLIS